MWSSTPHSRPQSPSFLGHVVGNEGLAIRLEIRLATGRLQIKPSGSGDENKHTSEIGIRDLQIWGREVVRIGDLN